MNGTATDWTLLQGQPLWLGLVALLAVLCLLAGVLSGRGLPVSRRSVLLGVRLLAVLLAVLAVLRPAREVDLTRAKRAPLGVLLDTSASMQLGETPLDQLARDWLRRAGDGLGELEPYYRLEDLELVSVPLVPGDAEPAAGNDAEPLQRSPLGATLEGLRARHPDLAGLLLLTDGRDTERPGQPPLGLDFPVYPVVPRGPELPDLWIEAAETPPVAFIRTPVELRVRLRARGLPARPVTVTLLEDGQPLVAGDAELDGEATLDLVFTPTRTGRRAYRLEVTPWAGEVTLANNRRQFSLSVIRDKTRVLLVAGTPTWDVKFLRRRLRQDPGVDLITFLILRTPQDMSLVPQKELSLIPFPTRELFSEELPSFDAVIFANFDYGPYVPLRYLRNIADFVKESGGGFAMLGGDRSFARGGYVGSPLEEILPLEIAGAAPGQGFRPGQFRPRLTTDGLAHPLMQWQGSSEDNQLLWNALPPLAGMNWTLRPKAGAVVLAENPEGRTEFGSQPLIALGEYGAGRTLAVATDSLWHWALPNAGAGGSATVYRDFWTRALRWLVHDPEMELVRLAQPRSPLRAGEEVRFRARVLDRTYQPAVGARVQGSLVREAGKPEAVVWSEVAPGEYASEPVRLPREGLWSVQLEAHLRGGFLGRDAAAFPVSGASPEEEHVGLDLDYLQRLAESSGGELIRDDGRQVLARLGEEGRARVEVIGRRVEELWPTPWLLCATLFLFAVDWALRRLWE